MLRSRMSYVKPIKRPKVMSLKKCAALILVSSLIVFAACLILSPISAGGAGRYLFVCALNYLPVLCAMVIFFALFDNIAAAVYLPGVFFLLMSLANHYMMALRHEPVRWQDVFLVEELVGISKSFGPAALAALAAGVLAVVAALAILLVKIKNESNRKLGWRLILLTAVPALILALELGAPVFGAPVPFDRLLLVPADASLMDIGEERGFAFYFCQSLTAGPQKPSVQAPAGLLDAGRARVPAGAQKPGVIAVMGESFSDIALSDALKPYNMQMALENFERAAGQGISGHIVVSGFGGGTSDTEFDFLTGINARDFRTAPFAYYLVDHPVPSIVTVLSAAGYYCEALHPGDPSYYYRRRAYPYLGFSRFLSLEDFGGIPFKGLYANENDTIAKVISEFELNTRDESRPFFEFCVTIQNHGPYKNKYPEVNRFLPDALPFGTGANPGGAGLGLSKSSYDALSNYLYGLRDADAALGKLLDYLQTSPKPAVLLYFGDHMPPMPPDVYSALLPEDTGAKPADAVKYYRMPFLIWANAAAKKTVTLPESPNGPISSCYLGGLLLQTLGCSDAYFDFINDIRAQYPILMDRNMYDAVGSSVSYAGSDLYKLYYALEYGRLIR